MGVSRTEQGDVKAIAAQEFLPPQQIDKRKALDSSFFGHGISMTSNSHSMLYFSNTRGRTRCGCQILLGVIFSLEE